MSLIFDIVAATLQLISYMTGLSYKEINIIVYYVMAPFLYLALIDRIYKKHFLKIIFGIGVIGLLLYIGNFRESSEWLFDKSVMFLLSFERFGLDYVAASVIICVVLPGVLFVYLFYCAYKSEIKKMLNR